MQRASEVACRLPNPEQGRGTPHYAQIESAAHEVGQRLSRIVQKNRASDVAAEHLPEHACPDCRNKCPVDSITRQITSIDGPVEVTETVAYCASCRRSCFPQRKALGLDPRESTPGFKRQLVVLNAELRSLKRAAMVTERVLG